MSLTAIAGNPNIPLHQEREIARFEAGARQAIENLRAHFDADAHLSPEQMADYRRRLAAERTTRQPDLDLPPCA
ncbi:MAG TPA: hypothetical protein VK019_07530 [Pseudomonas sp.]|nr:hypothetical protein [Pseudomonas sp.]